MIARDTDINLLNPETGTSALMLAALLGYLNMCNILIDAGADVNAKDHAGNTALHLAAQGYGEQLPVIQTLLQRGADANATNEDGVTPAALAKKNEKDACFKLLNSHTDESVEIPSYQQFDASQQEQKEQGIFSFT